MKKMLVMLFMVVLTVLTVNANGDTLDVKVAKARFLKILEDKFLDEMMKDYSSIMDSGANAIFFPDRFPITEEEVVQMVKSQLKLFSEENQGWNSYDDHFTMISKVKNGNIVFIIYSNEIIVVTVHGNSLSSFEDICLLEMWPKTSLGANRLSDEEAKVLQNHFGKIKQ